MLLTCLHPIAFGIRTLPERTDHQNGHKEVSIHTSLRRASERKSSTGCSVTSCHQSSLFDQISFDALRQAGQCKKHSCLMKARHISRRSSTIHSFSRPLGLERNESQVRRMHHASWKRRVSSSSPLTREECLNLMDGYSEHYSTQSCSGDVACKRTSNDRVSGLHTLFTSADIDTSIMIPRSLVAPANSHVQDVMEVLELLADSMCTYHEA